MNLNKVIVPISVNHQHLTHCCRVVWKRSFRIYVSWITLFTLNFCITCRPNLSHYYEIKFPLGRWICCNWMQFIFSISLLWAEEIIMKYFPFHYADFDFLKWMVDSVVWKKQFCVSTIQIMSIDQKHKNGLQNYKILLEFGAPFGMNYFQARWVSLKSILVY